MGGEVRDGGVGEGMAGCFLEGGGERRRREMGGRRE